MEKLVNAAKEMLNDLMDRDNLVWGRDKTVLGLVEVHPPENRNPHIKGKWYDVKATVENEEPMYIFCHNGTALEMYTTDWSWGFYEKPFTLVNRMIVW